MGLGFEDIYHKKVFPGGASSKEATCQCRRQETRVSFLGWEDPLEEGMATHSNILAWRIPKVRGACWATVHGGHKELDMTE